MQYNGSEGQMHPPDHTAILLDQTQELRRQSNALGWIVSQLQHGSEIHKELKSDVREVKADVALLKAAAVPGGTRNPVKFNVMADSLAGLLHAGKPYLIVCALVAGKWVGWAPSLIEPLIAKVVAAL